MLWYNCTVQDKTPIQRNLLDFVHALPAVPVPPVEHPAFFFIPDPECATHSSLFLASFQQVPLVGTLKNGESGWWVVPLNMVLTGCIKAAGRAYTFAVVRHKYPVRGWSPDPGFSNDNPHRISQVDHGSWQLRESDRQVSGISQGIIGTSLTSCARCVSSMH